MKTGANVFLRADGRWEARYQKGRNAQGRIIYGFVYAASQTEAEQKRAAILLKQNGNANASSVLASLNPHVSAPVIKDYLPEKEKLSPALQEDAVLALHTALVKSRESAAAVFFLCLHLGISSREGIALTYGDIRPEEGVIAITRSAVYKNKAMLLAERAKREIPLPPFVAAYLSAHKTGEEEPGHFIFNNSPHLVQSLRTVEVAFRKMAGGVLPKGTASAALRSTFIRRCLQAGMSAETVSALTGADKALLYRGFGMYIRPRPEEILSLTPLVRPAGKSLNLLILGAGSHGHGVKEIAEKLGVFQNICFLDDFVRAPGIRGKCSDYLCFLEEFPAAFPAFGNNPLRKEWAEKLRKAGFLLPRLIHPDTTVSQEAEIGEGTVILPQATINAGAVIGEACIIASNALVGFDACVGAYTHVECGGVVLKKTCVPEGSVIEAGSVFRRPEALG